MRNFPTILYGCILGSAAFAAFAQGQQGAANSAKLPAPTVFPAPGTYFNTTALSLMDPVPGTEIHYTWDGSEPNASSPVFDPRGVLFIAGVYDGNQGLKTGYTLPAGRLHWFPPTARRGCSKSWSVPAATPGARNRNGFTFRP